MHGNEYVYDNYMHGEKFVTKTAYTGKSLLSQQYMHWKECNQKCIQGS